MYNLRERQIIAVAAPLRRTGECHAIVSALDYRDCRHRDPLHRRSGGSVGASYCMCRSKTNPNIASCKSRKVCHGNQYCSGFCLRR
jgi:hypothetical protein